MRQQQHQQPDCWLPSNNPDASAARVLSQSLFLLFLPSNPMTGRISECLLMFCCCWLSRQSS